MNVLIANGPHEGCIVDTSNTSPFMILHRGGEQIEYRRSIFVIYADPMRPEKGHKEYWVAYTDPMPSDTDVVRQIKESKHQPFETKRKLMPL